MIKKTHYLKFVAIFLCTLILTLPFYSANALASLTVTKNTGEAEIPDFIDAQSDIWELEIIELIDYLVYYKFLIQLNDKKSS